MKNQDETLEDFLSNAQQRLEAKNAAEVWLRTPPAQARTEEFSFFVKRAYWTADEAAAILLGKNPAWVNREVLAVLRKRSDPPLPIQPDFSSSSLGWDQFLRISDLFSRAELAGELASPPRPSDVVVWAIKNDIPCPKELQEALEQHAASADQKPPEASRNELLQKAANELAARWKAEGRKLITKEDIAKALASGPDWYEMTADRIMRIIRVEWR